MPFLLDTTDTYPLSRESYRVPDLRTDGIDFGDGYSQEIASGINAAFDVWHLTFLSQLRADAITLVEILRNSRNGADNILKWTPPGETTPKYWKGSNIQDKPAEGIKWQVTVNLTQTYVLTA